MKQKTFAELLAAMPIAQAKRVLDTLTERQREKVLEEIFALHRNKTASN